MSRFAEFEERPPASCDAEVTVQTALVVKSFTVGDETGRLKETLGLLAGEGRDVL